MIRSLLLLSIILQLIIIGLLISSRSSVREIRHRLAALVMWQWSKMSKISAIIYAKLWQKGNGS